MLFFSSFDTVFGIQRRNSKETNVNQSFLCIFQCLQDVRFLPFVRRKIPGFFPSTLGKGPVPCYLENSVILAQFGNVKNNIKHSGSIPMNACVACET